MNRTMARRKTGSLEEMQEADNVKVGDRIRLVWTDDPSGLEPGSEGTVLMISEDVLPARRPGEKGRRVKKIWVEWDNLGRLALIEGYDKFEILQ